MKKYIIFTDEFGQTGGPQVLHKFCDLLNRCGHEAYLYPSYDSYELHPYNINESHSLTQKFNRIFSLTQTVPVGSPVSLDKIEQVYWVNGNFKTPVYIPDPQVSFGEEWVVIYPEVIFGNPLRAKNVVRYLLHTPGYHTGKIYYGSNELYFRHGEGPSAYEALNGFQYPGSKTSELYLPIFYIPTDIFYESDHTQKRAGTAYALRKGIGKEIQHELENSILIDGIRNHEIANIFRSVDTFISYDIDTFYSFLAVLCGCNSIVIPTEGISEESWRKRGWQTNGTAYGFDNLEKAHLTKGLVKNSLLEQERISQECVEKFVIEVNEYFK